MEKIVEAFNNKDIYPHPVKYIKKMETHCSWVFLTGEYAYKIKKPVNFGFLDFSTPEKRKYFIEREYRLNKEISPEIYLEVVPISVDNGRINLENKGEIIEYALKMKEMPQETIMKNLLEKNAVSLKDVYSLVKKIADFHKNAESSEETKKHGGFEKVKFNWEENFKQTKEFIGITLDRTTFETIERNIKEFIATNEELFLKREREGKVRFCHGDLHSGNIFIYKGIPYVFDRIEFNMRFACSDTASDIAFFLMDLEFLGKKYFSDFSALRYAERTDDYEFIKLLDFYICYRAYVRGKVNSFLYQASKNEKVRSKAEEYFKLSLQYASLIGQRPQIYVICGLPGSGKSTIAEIVSRFKKGVQIKSDVERRILFNMDLNSHYYNDFEKGFYSPLATQKTYNRMHTLAEMLIKNNKTVVLDATYSKKELVKEIIEVAERRRVPLKIICCTTTDEIAKERIEKKKHSSESDAYWEVYLKMKSKFVPPENAILLDTSGAVKEVEKKVARIL